MARNGQKLSGKRIGIVGKGGAGKSTTTILLAKVLRERGYEVCILDADSTNVGLYRALDLDHPPKSLIEYFGGMVFSGGLVTCPVDDPTPLPGAELALNSLTEEYYARNPEGIILLAAGKIGDMGPGAGCDGPINKIARDMKVKMPGMAPVTLVDFKAGFEDSARGAITSLDWVLVVVDPTNAAIQMAIHMKEMVEQIQAGIPPATKHLEDPELAEMARKIFREAKIKDAMVILNRIRNEEMEAYLRKKLSAGGIEPIGSISEDPALTTIWLEGSPLEAAELCKQADRIVAILEKNVESQPAG
jgi:CO dehydrogenase nickel-insertion accessory protein CooC1